MELTFPAERAVLSDHGDREDVRKAVETSFVNSEDTVKRVMCIEFGLSWRTVGQVLQFWSRIWYRSSV
jgi:hypothetical protein